MFFTAGAPLLQVPEPEGFTASEDFLVSDNASCICDEIRAESKEARLAGLSAKKEEVDSRTSLLSTCLFAGVIAGSAVNDCCGAFPAKFGNVLLVSKLSMKLADRSSDKEPMVDEQMNDHSLHLQVKN